MVTAYHDFNGDMKFREIFIQGNVVFESVVKKRKRSLGPALAKAIYAMKTNWKIIRYV